jgi:hypothetical protein
MLAYTVCGQSMSRSVLEKECHDFNKLGERMAAVNDGKPHKLCHAHAIFLVGIPRP